MLRSVKSSRLETVLDELHYPLDREAAASAFDDVTVVLAEGAVNLGDSIRESGEDAFESVDDLANEIRSGLPRHAVGEPSQPDGEG